MFVRIDYTTLMCNSVSSPTHLYFERSSFVLRACLHFLFASFLDRARAHFETERALISSSRQLRPWSPRCSRVFLSNTLVLGSPFLRRTLGWEENVGTRAPVHQNPCYCRTPPVIVPKHFLHPGRRTRFRYTTSFFEKHRILLTSSFSCPNLKNIAYYLSLASAAKIRKTSHTT